MFRATQGHWGGTYSRGGCIQRRTPKTRKHAVIHRDKTIDETKSDYSLGALPHPSFRSVRGRRDSEGISGLPLTLALSSAPLPYDRTVQEQQVHVGPGDHRRRRVKHAPSRSRFIHQSRNPNAGTTTSRAANRLAPNRHTSGKIGLQQNGKRRFTPAGHFPSPHRARSPPKRPPHADAARITSNAFSTSPAPQQAESAAPVDREPGAVPVEIS